MTGVRLLDGVRGEKPKRMDRSSVEILGRHAGLGRAGAWRRRRLELCRMISRNARGPSSIDEASPFDFEDRGLSRRALSAPPSR